jgi:uncharacterized protein
MSSMVLEPSKPSKGRRIWRTLWISLLVLVVAFHLAGGWYFGSVLVADGFQPAGPDTTPNVQVVSTDAGTVELRPTVDDLAMLVRPGIFGLDHDRGYGRLGAIVSDGATVVRAYESLEGDPPAVGANGRIEGFAFPPDPAAALGRPVETVSYTSPLGDFEAWQVEGTLPDWVVHVHGKGAPLSEAIRLMRPLADASYPQLVITYRNDEGQPADPSGFYQYGATEWEDVAAAVEHARSQGAQRVILVGYSTGASHVLAYLYRAPREGVAAAILDAPNIDFSTTVDFNAAQREVPVLGIPIPVTVSFLAKWYASLRTGVNWESIDYIDRADRLAVPTLVFHGAEDQSVPPASSRAFQVARPQFVTLVEVGAAGHVESWNVDPEAYESRVLAFLQAAGA